VRPGDIEPYQPDKNKQTKKNQRQPPGNKIKCRHNSEHQNEAAPSKKAPSPNNKPSHSFCLLSEILKLQINAA